MTTMNASALANNLTNPAKTYLWEMMFPDPTGGDAETLLLRCQSAVLPGRGLSEILIPFKQSAGIKFPGKLTYPQTFTLVFEEGEDRAIFDAFYTWNQSILNDETNIGAISVKKDIHLHLIDTDGTVALRIRFVGCFPQDVPDIALDYGSDERIRFSITFSYDAWRKIT